MALILWKPHVSESFPNGYTSKGIRNLVEAGGHMHEDLVFLISHLENEGREWSVARIVCDSSQVKLVHIGWWKALCDMVSYEGFMPLKEAERRYLS